MKIWTPILAAGAILALAVPAANSAVPLDAKSSRSNAVMRAPSSELVSVGLKSKTQAAQIKALLATNKALTAKVSVLQTRINQLEAALRPPEPPPIVPIDTKPDDESCLSYVMCTPEEECRIWGTNCQLVTQTAPPIVVEAATEESSPVTSVSSSSGSSENNGTTSTSGSSGMECASLADPAMSSAYPVDYDWAC